MLFFLDITSVIKIALITVFQRDDNAISTLNPWSPSVEINIGFLWTI